MFKGKLFVALGVTLLLTTLSITTSSCNNRATAPLAGAPPAAPPTPPPTPPTDQPGTQGVTVTIPLGASLLTTDAFGVNPLIITVGTTVTWVNGDNVAHTSSSTTGVWESGNLDPGQSFSFTFTQIGTFPYFCRIHPNMLGTVQVNEAPQAAQEFKAQLSGANEVPPVVTGASGEAKVEIEPGDEPGEGMEFKFDVQIMNITGVTASHIHVGAVGMNGPIIFTLSAGPFTDRVQGELTPANFSPAPASGINTFQDGIDAIVAGNTYVNVHTVVNPGGEIRGQLVRE